HVVIAAANGQKILDTQLNAPWLLVGLTPGAYTVSVAHPGAPIQQRKVLIAAGKRERIVIQLDVPADTAKNPAPAK
ncbi:MAG: carboxypeptidase-like regulatory domain-containing protein, partial [Pseudomonadota bacterium]|nr:carboxypeptidase-like regulatory domain-containing protein [Pseudomonadota bacterium]